MTTDRQRAANQRNAEKSTGPRTPEGKVRSSANAITHGGYVGQVDPIRSQLLGEDPDTTQAVVDGILEALDPRNGLEFTAAMSVATRTIGQMRVNRLLAPLVDGIEATTVYDLEHLEAGAAAEFARSALVALQVAEGNDTGTEVNWRYLTHGVQHRIFSDGKIKRLKFRDPDGTVRDATTNDELVADFLHVVDQQFTSRDEARDYLTSQYHQSLAVVDHQNLKVRQAQAERILTEFERTTPLFERTDRGVARALKTYESIRDRFPHQPQQDTPHPVEDTDDED